MKESMFIVNIIIVYVLVVFLFYIYMFMFFGLDLGNFVRRFGI